MTIHEHNPEPHNPLGMDGIEFIEYATSQPQAFGAVLQNMGFAAVARHRSREVMLYRQGPMNLIVNSHGAPDATPTVSALALRVRDAAFAHRHALDLGAWDMPTRASAMELNIPGIHGVGDSLVYFVDRYRDFSIYDVDFVALAGVDPRPAALAGLHYFGVVQSILPERTRDWVDFYRQLFDFSVLPRGQYFGVLPKGTLLESPCHKFYLQLVEPPPGADDVHWDEGLVRIGLGAPDVPAAVRALRARGVVFVDHGAVQPSDKGALTQFYLGGVTFELVVSHLQP
ncbi:MAG: 4-hydroxyphenylpyruvate dioxygenase [Betaproteobacteria bacterium RIFCSPLOWO2_12_FULL_65_14]|nr:MAG: 4-hydroxyphenylpyruvate dioxygenase [Betaproteobacteria bacterium RIFCSPLOWO2_12_FULL_65_14]